MTNAQNTACDIKHLSKLTFSLILNFNRNFGLIGKFAIQIHTDNQFGLIQKDYLFYSHPMCIYNIRYFVQITFNVPATDSGVQRPNHYTTEPYGSIWLEFKIACLVHQSLASLALTYLTTDIHLVSKYGRHPLRSSTDRTLTVPRTHNRFGDRSFAVAGPRLWNSLPISLWQISSYGQFKRYLKNHLFAKFATWVITAQCDAWFSALYKYSYLLTYLIKSKIGSRYS